jgi:hypothetical protein
MVANGGQQDVIPEWLGQEREMGETGRMFMSCAVSP